MKETLRKIVNIVCDYLRINEDLFFAARNSPRILEARKYVSYMAFEVHKIPGNIVSKYLGVHADRGSITRGRSQSVKDAIQYDCSSQTALDIEAIEKLCEKKI